MREDRDLYKKSLTNGQTLADDSYKTSVNTVRAVSIIYAIDKILEMEVLDK